MIYSLSICHFQMHSLFCREVVNWLYCEWQTQSGTSGRQRGFAPPLAVLLEEETDEVKAPCDRKISQKINAFRLLYIMIHIFTLISSQIFHIFVRKSSLIIYCLYGKYFPL